MALQWGCRTSYRTIRLSYIFSINDALRGCQLLKICRVHFSDPPCAGGSFAKKPSAFLVDRGRVLGLTFLQGFSTLSTQSCGVLSAPRRPPPLAGAWGRSQGYALQDVETLVYALFSSAEKIILHQRLDSDLHDHFHDHFLRALSFCF